MQRTLETPYRISAHSIWGLSFPERLAKVAALYSTELLDGADVAFSLVKRGGRWCKLLHVVGLDKSPRCWSYRSFFPPEHSLSVREVEVSRGIEDVLRTYCLLFDESVTLYCTIIGPEINGNPYRRKASEVYVVSIFDHKRGRFLTLEEKQTACAYLDMQLTPLRRIFFVDELLAMEDPRSFIVEAASGPSVLTITHPLVERKGLLLRSLMDDSFAFKVLSLDYSGQINEESL